MLACDSRKVGYQRLLYVMDWDHSMSLTSRPVTVFLFEYAEHSVLLMLQRWRPDSAVGIGVLPIDSDVQAKTPDAAAAAADTAATTVVIGDAGGGVSNSATVLRRHAQFVMETLGAAVECLELDDSSVFANILVALGQIHGTYDVKQHYLPVSDISLSAGCIDKWGHIGID